MARPRIRRYLRQQAEKKANQLKALCEKCNRILRGNCANCGKLLHSSRWCETCDKGHPRSPF